MVMTLKNEIMKKVRTIFLWRRLALPSVVFVASVVVIISTVSVSQVIANMPEIVDIKSVARFFAAAFAHTDIVIKSALVAGLVFSVLTLKGALESRRLSVRLERV